MQTIDELLAAGPGHVAFERWRYEITVMRAAGMNLLPRVAEMARKAEQVAEKVADNDSGVIDSLLMTGVALDAPEQVHQWLCGLARLLRSEAKGAAA